MPEGEPTLAAREVCAVLTRATFFAGLSFFAWGLSVGPLAVIYRSLRRDGFRLGVMPLKLPCILVPESFSAFCPVLPLLTCFNS